MFCLAKFREERPDAQRDVILANPLATLVTKVGHHLTVDHIPMILHSDPAPNGVLRGHIAAANPLAGEASGETDALAVFHGPQAYVSPSWYPSKQSHGKVVPTWNYCVVHVHGRLAFRREVAWLRDHLDALSDMMEQHRAEPWAPSDAPGDFVDRQLRAIVGIELRIAWIDGICKTSQNKSVPDRNGVASGLRDERTEEAGRMAEIVERQVKDTWQS